MRRGGRASVWTWPRVDGRGHGLSDECADAPVDDEAADGVSDEGPVHPDAGHVVIEQVQLVGHVAEVDQATGVAAHVTGELCGTCPRPR